MILTELPRIAHNACHGEYISLKFYFIASYFIFSPEYDDSNVDDDGNSMGNGEGGGGRKKREKTKKNPTFMEGVSGTFVLTDQPKLKNIQRQVQEMCGWKR